MNALKEKWLDVSERDNFRELEAIVAKGIKSFVVVGNALKEIRDSKLYREHYKTFEKYVSERWKINRQRAYQLIEAAEAKSNLSKILDKNKTADAINTESQLRELKDVPSESIEAVVSKAAALAGEDKITASDLKQARQEVLCEVTAVAKDLVFHDVDDDDAPKQSAPKAKKRASAPKQDFGIELHEWLRRNTGNLQAYSEMINGLTGDWKEVLQLNHPVIWDEFAKAVCQLHASIEKARD